METWGKDARSEAVITDLDALVPKDHLLRKIEKVMDIFDDKIFVSGKTAACQSNRFGSYSEFFLSERLCSNSCYLTILNNKTRYTGFLQDGNAFFYSVFLQCCNAAGHFRTSFIRNEINQTNLSGIFVADDDTSYGTDLLREVPYLRGIVFTECDRIICASANLSCSALSLCRKPVFSRYSAFIVLTPFFRLLRTNDCSALPKVFSW